MLNLVGYGVRIVKQRIDSKLLDEIWRDRPSKPREVYDTRDSGFMLRQQPSGQISFYVRYRAPLDGRQTRSIIGKYQRSADGKEVTSLVEIRKQARAVLHRIQAEKIDPVALRREEKAAAQNELTLDQFLKSHYEPEIKRTKRTGIDMVRRLRYCFSSLIDRQLREFTKQRILDWRLKRLDEVDEDGRAKVSFNTVNKDIRQLRTAFAFAVENDLISAIPFPKIKPLDETDEKRVRFLSEDEENRLRGALDRREDKRRAGRESANSLRLRYGKKVLHPMSGAFTDSLKPRIIVSINTGVRKSELLSLKWGSIDWDAKLMTVHAWTAKSKVTRRINLNSEAMATLTAWRDQRANAHPDGWIFPGKVPGRPQNEIKTAWKNLLEDAEIKDFHWHDQRHHFASRLVIEGVDLNRVRELMGHKTLAMTLRYAHLAPGHTAQAVETIVRKSVPVESPPEPPKVIEIEAERKKRKSG